MEILRQPDSLSLLGNLKEFLISSQDNVTFSLSTEIDGVPTTLITESYIPDAAGRISIDVTEICRQYLKTELPGDNVVAQENAARTFTATIGATSVSFRVVNASVRNLALTPTDYLEYNFLTLQPQTKKVSWHSPEYLSYYFVGTADIKAKFYLVSGDTETVTVASITPELEPGENGNGGTIRLVNKVYTVNTTLSRLMALSSHSTDELQGIVDVWVEQFGDRKSYIQRYVYAPATGEEHHYLAVNSLGGIDTFTFHGEQKISGEIEHQVAENNDLKISVTQDGQRKYRQTTGYLGVQDAEWLWEFLHSNQQWVVADGTAEAIALQSSSLSQGDITALNSSSFDFVLAREGGLLPESRRDETFPDITVPSPVSDLFFLTPRLIDFPAASGDSEIVFPVQTPYSNTWKYLTLSVLSEKLSLSIIPDHTHGNLSILNELGDVDGHLTYRGSAIGSGNAITLPIAISDVDGLRTVLNSKANSNHTHHWTDISDRPLRLSDFTNDLISSWALAATKPDYSWSEIGSKPTTLSGYGITDGYSSLSTTGSGNAITSVSGSGHALTFTKGNTFVDLASGQTISGKKHISYLDVTGALAIPQVEPTSESGKVFEYIDNSGSFGEVASAVTPADLKDLVLKINGVTKTTYNPASAASFNVDLTDYATQSWVEAKNYLQGITKAMVEAVLTGNITSHTHSQYLTSHQSLTGYATQSWVQQQGYLTSHQSLADYALKSEIPTSMAWTAITGRPTKLSQFTNDIISSWALAATKPSYSWSEIVSKPTTISGYGVTSIPEAYLEWGGKNFSASYGPVDAAMVSELGSNRFAFGAAAAIEVYYSRDNGVTWLDYGTTDALKTRLVSGLSAAYIIGKASSNDVANASYQLRIRIGTGIGLYTTLNKFIIYVGTNGTTGNWCTIRKRLKSDQTAENDNWAIVSEKVPINGWSGWNVINTSGITFGNGSGQYGQLEFTFGCTGYNGNGTTHTGLAVYKLLAFGGQGWSTPSHMASFNHLYTYDENQNMLLPAGLFPKKDNTSSHILGSSSQRWYAVYATNLYGNLAWTYIQNKPSTLSGYGITDGYSSLSTTGSGNAITVVSGSGHALTFTKGNTFVDLASEQTISGKKHISYLDVTGAFAVPQVEPSAEAGKVFEYIDNSGSFGEAASAITPADLKDLVLKINGVTKTTYNPASASSFNVDLTDYATQSWVEAKNYLQGITKAMVEAVLTGNITSHTHSQYLTSHQSLTGYATQSWVQQQGYLTSHQSLADYALKSEIPTSMAWTAITGRPTKLSQFTNDIISSWALAASKPTYTAAEVGALPSNTHIPEDVKMGIVVGKLYRNDVRGTGNIGITGNAGYIPTTAVAGTYTVAIYMLSTTQSYSMNVTYGTNTYTLSTTNGVISDVRNLTVAANSTWSASIPGSTPVAAGTYLVVTLYKRMTTATTIGVAAVTNNYTDLDNKPSTIAGYGITDAYISNGTITLGRNSITPLTSFTETDPTVPSWAKTTTKPSYTLDEVSDGTTRKLSDYMLSSSFTKAAITNLLGNDTFAPYNSNGYLPLNGGEMTGNITISAANSKDIGSSTNDWRNVYVRNIISNDALTLKTTAAKTLTILSAGGINIQSTANLNIQYKKTGDTAWSNALSANASSGGVGVGNSTYTLQFIGSSLTYNIYGAINQRVRYNDTWINVLSTTIASSTAGYITLGSGAHQTVINGSLTDFKIAGTGKWRIDANGHFIPMTTNTVNLGSSSRYVAAGYIVDLNIYTSILPATNNTGNLGSSSKRWSSLYTQAVDCSDLLLIPTIEPSSVPAGKVAEYIDLTGSFAN